MKETVPYPIKNINNVHLSSPCYETQQQARENKRNDPPPHAERYTI